MIWISSWILFITMSQIPIFEFIKLRLRIFKPAVQKRKLSAVNQFLFYLYQHQVIEDYHRLVLPKVSVPKSHDQELLDLSLLWEGSDLSQGALDCPLDCRDGLVA